MCIIEISDKFVHFVFEDQGWYAEFLLKTNLKFLLIKIGARFNLKIDLVTLHTYTGEREELRLEQIFGLSSTARKIIKKECNNCCVVKHIVKEEKFKV